MNFHDLPVRLLDLLKVSGWSEGRKIDISTWLELLMKEGYTPFPLAAQILSEFGDLRIDPRAHQTTAFLKGECIDFNVIIAASGEYDRISAWQNHLQATLFPLGEVGFLLFFVSDKGDFYLGERPGDLWYVASSVEQALRVILTDIMTLRKIELPYKSL